MLQTENKTDVEITIQGSSVAVNEVNVTNIEVNERIAPQSKKSIIVKPLAVGFPHDDEASTISAQL